MTTSILNECLKLKDQHIFEIEKYLHSINVHIFDSIINGMRAEEASGSLNEIEAKQKVLYILCGFSEDSPMLIIRQDDKAEKEAICDYLQIPDIYRENLWRLSDKNVRQAVTDYVTRFAGPLFRVWVFMKIQYNDFEYDVTNRNFVTKKGEEESVVYQYSPKDHGDAIAQMNRLAKQIEQVEKEIKSQVKRLDGIEAIKEWKAKSTKKGAGARSGNVESSKYIN